MGKKNNNFVFQDEESGKCTIHLGVRVNLRDGVQVSSVKAPLLVLACLIGCSHLKRLPCF